jgi:exopolysaccharide biosynthesis polyprenyl glycosylphosphotransferase
MNSEDLVMNSKLFLSEESTFVKQSVTPQVLPGLLLSTDILGLFVSLGMALWLRQSEGLKITDPALYGFGLLVIIGLYLANTYHPDSQIVGLRAPARIIISNIIVAFFASGVIYLLGAWRQNPLLWRGTIVPCLLVFTLWAVTSRLLATNWVRSHSEQSRWLILGANDSAMQFCRKFLARYPLVKLAVLTESKSERIQPYEITRTKEASHRSEEIQIFSLDKKRFKLEGKLDSHSEAQSESNSENQQSQFTQTLEPENQRFFTPSQNVNCLGNLNDLPNLVYYPWSGVVVATHKELADEQVRQLMPLRLQGIPIYRLPEAYENIWFKLPSSLLEDTWFAFSAGFNLFPGGFSLKVKRIADLFFTIALLTLLSPLMLLTALAIKLDSPGSVFYSQLRTGLNGKPFKVHKFRSMSQDAEKQGAQWASKSDSRITRVGRLIRLTRIDELPQILNVLQGQMSLIGPRPERPEFDAKLKEEIPYYEVRYLVKPGITGWAQVMYPYGASIEDAYEKLSYDLYYIKNYSLWLDIAIFFKTIRVVLLGKGR